MSEIKQYDTEVRLEAVMGTNHYGVHIHAMTTEDLHSKSGIAVELAWRDLRIEQLIAQLEAAQKERDALREVHIGAGSNTRAAADIYFQLVEELEVPAGGSLVGVVDNLKAELSAANERLKCEPVPVEYQYRYHNHGTGCGEWCRVLTKERYEELQREHAGDNDFVFRMLFTAPQKPVALLDKYVRNEKGQYILDGKCEPRIGFAVGWNAAIRAADGKVEGE
ncbi:TPA: hypothetical protein PXJ50_001398 [Yersinia enterocolitica]|uniref:hypothetical protein n=1 Tax=Yersinia enterocolitica TaxID=630 RepID=UPI0028D9FFEB|nr:hypothetical protein [Yersinia enterocolitica]HDL6529707.1 hypothetical protein [Yersinia enterocolitica]HDL6667992.1 hypothetical protein [Yersinia enterocolitica]HDL6726963.1 hypothetical protein [Yersinia enterocolitica]HDL6735994.1 hypothetical protein [Yersinia enterocolitica]